MTKKTLKINTIASSSFILTAIIIFFFARDIADADLLFNFSSVIGAFWFFLGVLIPLLFSYSYRTLASEVMQKNIKKHPLKKFFLINNKDTNNG